ncbi:MAG: DUF309 domain-containing protein [bacterium]
MTHTAPSREPLPRYAPGRDLPPYAFVGGGPFPHPRNQEGGHSLGEPEPKAAPLAPEAWEENEAYRYGMDLFNHGYYWEAHEQWEAVWVASGREGTAAEFLKGLIKLAACGVKVRQERNRGIRRHACRAIGHFQRVIEEAGRRSYAGLDLDELILFAEDILENPEGSGPDGGERVTVVFDRTLQPGGDEDTPPSAGP